MPRSKTMAAGLVTVALTTLLGGCNLSKTGAVAPSAPDVVTVLPLVYGSATTLRFDPTTVSALTALGVKVSSSGTAVSASDGSSVDFPITSGYAEVHLQHGIKPGWIQGSISHQGSGLTLTGPVPPDTIPGPPSTSPPVTSTTVTLSDFTADPGNSVLYATVNGQLPQIPLLTLDGGAVTETTDSTGAVVLDGTVAQLTDTAATALDQAFGTTALHAGLPVGTVRLALTGQAVTYNATKDHVTAYSRLSGQSTTLTLDAGTASALQGIGVSLAPLGGTSLDASNGTATFPITGGMVAVHSNKGFRPGYVVGSVLHQGSGLSFTGPNGATILTTDYTVDPGDSILYATVADRVGVPLLYLDGAKLQVAAQGGNVTLDGTVAQLTSAAATALDQAFGTTAVRGGTPLGVVHLVAAGQPGS